MNETITAMGGYEALALNVIKAIVFLILGYFFAGFASRIVRDRLGKVERLDQTLAVFFSSLVRWGVLAVVVIAVLQLVGFQATSLVAVLGAASLAIGLALQGTLSDVASGVMLIIFRPYRLGDYVEVGGTAGTVKEINLFVTELATPDNVQIIMPNSKARSSVITNYSAHPTRRVDITFGVDYSDDADKAIELITAIATSDERVLKDPEPWVRVVNLGESSVDITARLWCNSADYWDLKFHMTKAVKEAFDKDGISIPYPHRVEVVKKAS
ncbi:mechanosensitive ion channel family protein [Pseudovibrio sp. SPO723]|uniref:mechanosensitive ion channel family protein n=1 Tax=Nesiotobacter zosterae TaxID=392721 RepID=UPI0029C30958|nr:mechanosensitive ion channel domain-containing protein [Pseudovibrio sp. SPO723]MDX5593434.1 mechanosensitive ion channel [Pseudovibrio sp. SPO723]